jgi:hypothetical protein
MEATEQVYSSKRQRSEDKARGLGKWLLGACILVVVLAASGCAQITPTLDKAVNTCFALDGSPSYTRGEGVEKFSCDRPSVTAVRASR